MNTHSGGGQRRLLRPSSLFVLLLALLLALPAAAVAQQGGGGSGGGGGGGGGAPDTGSDFSDMVVALRDVDGVPILKDFTYVDDEGATVTDRCVQPISYTEVPGAATATNGVDGEEVWLVPLQGEDLPDASATAEETEELEVCDPKPNYAYYVAEAELERLNQARTTEDVMDRKLAEVAHRLLGTSTVTLDPAGRLVTDGLLVDAPPENAAIHETLLETGTLPNLGSAPASVDPIVGLGDPLDAWELAATALGGAASKYTPLSIDSILYYNRVTNAVEDSITDPAAWELPYLEAFNGTRDEKFLDYASDSYTFSYNRADMFPGAATWFDIDTMTWNVEPLLDLVDFEPLPASAVDGTLQNAVAFAQLVDDARAMIAFIHQYEVLTGFHADPVRVDTYDEQLDAIVNPAVGWSDLPARLVQTRTVPVTATALNPWMGEPIDDALLQIRISAPEAFTDPSQVTAVSQDGGVPVPFSLEGGDLVGHWGPPTGFPMPRLYNESTTFDVTIAGDAPVGTYTLTLDLVSVSDADGAEPRATTTANLEVSDDVLTAWWEEVPVVTDQAAYTPMSAAVFSPESEGTIADASLRVTFDAQEDFTSTADIKAYLDAVGMAFVLDNGDLVGTWPLGEMAPGFDEAFTWQVFVADGAPLGLYTLDLDVVDASGTVLTDSTATAETTVAEAVEHGKAPGDFTITLTPVGDLGSDAAFEFGAEGDTSGVIFQCKLEKDGEYWLEHGDEPPTTEEEEWTTCTSPKEYTDLPEGEYEFFARGRRGEVFSPVLSETWVVAPVASPDFEDVPLTHPFSTEISWMVDEGITTGYADGLFHPSQDVTRQAAAAFLYRMAGSPEGDYGNTFTDVPVSHPFHAEISWAASEGIVEGYDDGTFRPGTDVTRQAAAAFLYRLAESPAGDYVNTFTDVPVGHPFHTEISWAAEQEIVNGYSDETFRPGIDVTRMAMAAFLHRHGLDR